ncbi:MAG: ribonuclease HI family protein [Deltaproteobacteria bacterium]|nr:ribonuclease HI family protein [Deltaproteobacteria bacterium]
MTAAAGRAVVVYTDGASRGNPGPAGAGWVIEEPGGRVLAAGHAFLGRRTNNEAEYEAVVRALAAAQEMGAADVQLRSDSELLVRQLNGQYRVRAAGLVPLHEQVRETARGFARFEARHVPREDNTRADAQANAAIDEA